MLTRKHFAAIASCIPSRADDTVQDIWEGAYAVGFNEARIQIAKALADVCKHENPNFDRARFLTACGVN